MFLQVVLRGRAQAERLLLPRSAIRDGKIYLIDEQQRLKTQKVDVLFNQDNISVINSGLKADDKVVVSDLIPAVDGMLLNPQKDELLQQQLQQNVGDKS